ncbi:MAG: type I-U CRISPR-associated protein Csx17 [Planctomycetaceae bacterium]
MSQKTLHAIPLDGINVDSLGHYLTGLGVLAALAQRWPAVRTCWDQGRFKLLSNEIADLDRVTSYLLDEWIPTPYERWWSASQKADTKAKSSSRLWAERNERPCDDVRVLDAHVVGMGRNCFNPVLGTGGNVGKRDLAKACSDASKLLKKAERGEWLKATLTGIADCAMPDLANGGTWFVFANKTFNSGQSWYREGQLSPWSVLFSIEGVFQLVGGVNRRLGSRSRPYAVFPFVSDPSQPETDGEIAMSRGEFWAPLWRYPATLSEVATLIQRGLAQVGGRAAQAPSEFAVAAVATGVDAGLAEFARFELRQTTSSQVFEAIPRERIAVTAHPPTRKRRDEQSQPSEASAVSELRSVAAHQLLRLFESRWIDRLPFEPRDSKQRGKFVGLRGPIEAAIVRASEHPDDPTRWQSLLLTLAKSQGKIDRNKALRERSIALPPLSPDWFKLAFHSDEALPLEIELARAIASVGWQPNERDLPLLCNVFGVEAVHHGRTTGDSRTGRVRSVKLPKVRPAAAVWGNGSPLSLLLDVTHRRLIDASHSESRPFLGARDCECRLPILRKLLCDDGTIDLELVVQWIPAFSLIDWSQYNCHNQLRSDVESIPLDGTALLHSLAKPLFHGRRFSLNTSGRKRSAGDERWLYPEESEGLPLGFQRRLFNLLRFNSLDEAMNLMRDRYRAFGHEIVMPSTGFSADGERVAAALLIPVGDTELADGLRRWLQPVRAKPTS